jgi:hypothetical protein
MKKGGRFLFLYITVLSTIRTGLEVSKSQRPSRLLYHKGF